MRTTTKALTALIAAATPAYAATGEANGLGILTIAFIGFVALIVVFQMVPAVTLFIGMVKGLFATTKQNPDTAHKDARM
ncbi:hypothetical protein [Geomesophilobacter sediminis]|uniref:Uncharacterized protein n=1 Tax=Geomesophilobacter sediminis TaxID=2798584 RepID=A0A8J7J0U9_9BACT|nr:hypothetical protein [Geomesophilobacter sediminis]MBJ6726302.1 hypothetical protein [Geomesophilobacter sediminis]